MSSPSSKRVRLTDDEKTIKIGEILEDENLDVMSDMQMDMVDVFHDRFMDAGLKATQSSFEVSFNKETREIRLSVSYILDYWEDFYLKSHALYEICCCLNCKEVKTWFKQTSTWKGTPEEGIRQTAEKLKLLNKHAKNCKDPEQWLDDATEFEDWFLKTMGHPVTDLIKCI